MKQQQKREHVNISNHLIVSNNKVQSCVYLSIKQKNCNKVATIAFLYIRHNNFFNKIVC